MSNNQSQSQQKRKTSSSPFSRDVFITNQKMKSLQQQTEQILKKNKLKNKTLENNLTEIKGTNNNNNDNNKDTSPQSSSFSSSAIIKDNPTSATTSPKISPRTQFSMNSIPSQTRIPSSKSYNKQQYNQQTSQQILSSTNGSTITANINKPTNFNTNSTTHNLSKQAQNTLKQLKQTLHNGKNLNNHASLIPPKNQMIIFNNTSIPKSHQDILINNRISAVQNSNSSAKNGSSDDTPKFKPMKQNGQKYSESYQFSDFNSIEQDEIPNSVNILSSVYSFGHEIEEQEEQVKRCKFTENNEDQNNIQNSLDENLGYSSQKEKAEKKKRVSFCAPVIHCYSTEERSVPNINYSEKYPVKSNLSIQSLSSIPSLTSFKKSILNPNAATTSPANQRSISPTSNISNQPVSIIKKTENKVLQQRSSLHYIDSEYEKQQQTLKTMIQNQSQSQNNISSKPNIIVINSNANSNNNNSNSNNNKINQNNNKQQNNNSNNNNNNGENEQRLQNHHLFESFAPNQGQQYLYNNNNSKSQQKLDPTQIPLNQKLIVEQQNSTKNNELEQVQISNINQLKGQTQESQQQQEIDKNKDIQPKEDKLSKLEEMRKMLVKENTQIAEIISASPIKKTTSHEFILCKELLGQGGFNPTSNNNENDINNCNNTTTSNSVKNNNKISQNHSNLLERIQEKKDQFFLNYSKPNQSDPLTQLNQNTITQVNNLYYPQIQSNINISENNNNNNNINTNNNNQTTILTSKQFADAPSSFSSFVSSYSPQVNRGEQVVGCTNIAGNEIKLSAINPLINSSFALGSQMTLSPQESIITLQNSRNNLSNSNNLSYNTNNNINMYNPILNNSNSNINPSNSFGMKNSNQIESYYINQKGISMPTTMQQNSDALSPLLNSHLNTNSSNINSNKTDNSSSNQYYSNLEQYKVQVQSFDSQDNSKIQLNSSQLQSNQISTVKINFESFANSSLNLTKENNQKEENIKPENSNNIIPTSCNNKNNNYSNINQNSPFSSLSNQNTTMTTNTTQNNRQSFDITWRTEQEMTPSEYFLSFVTNNPKPCPIPNINPGGASNNSINGTRKNSWNVKEAQITGQHFIPQNRQFNETTANINTSLDIYSNNYSIQLNSYQKDIQFNSFSNYGLHKSSKSPSRVASLKPNSQLLSSNSNNNINNNLSSQKSNNNFSSSYTSTQSVRGNSSSKTNLTKKQEDNQINQDQTKSFSNYLISSSHNIPSTQSNSKKRLITNKQSESANTSLVNQSSGQQSSSSISQNQLKKPIILEYNSVNSVKKQPERQINNNICSRKTNQQQGNIKKDTTSLYNIPKLAMQSKANTQNACQQNYYQLQKEVIPKEYSRNHSTEQQKQQLQFIPLN